MKPVVVTLSLALAIPLAAQRASAETRRVQDPSGASMCADADGELAPLADCAHLLPDADEYMVQADPSGAPMCFAKSGELAPMSMCGPRAFRSVAVRSFRTARDPSGAPMCFDDGSQLAPLAACDARPALAQSTERSSSAPWR